MLGEGYRHSYDDLINEIKRDSSHEIILAKTNKSMWQILHNCVLSIVPGGITSYEAAYAGLPTITMLENEEQLYLIQELLERNTSIYIGKMSHDNMIKLNDVITELHNNRYQLLQMHLNTKKIIDGKGAGRIYKVCVDYIKQLPNEEN